MPRDIDSVPPIIQNLIDKLRNSQSEEWARENTCLELEKIAQVCEREARQYRAKKAKRR